MHPHLVTLPGGIEITTYGFFLTVGFLSAVWIAMRRATKVNADPDRVLDASFFALIFGVVGARAMFVMHYWRPQFSDAPNPFLAALDIRQGGLEFLGGLLGAMAAVLVYFLVTKQSIRLYLDIMVPSSMWGLAWGRIGCFFNGCCFGGLCAVGGTADAPPVNSVHFPYGSPAHVRQWEDREVTVPAELIITTGRHASLLPAKALTMSYERRQGMLQEFKKLKEELEEAKKAGNDPQKVQRLTKTLESAALALQREGLIELERAKNFPSREHPDRDMSASELEMLAQDTHARAAHPTQLYASLHALILFGFLSAVFYRRERHGVVIAALLITYPIGRFLLELIRGDNPHDVGGLTISQFIGLSMSVVGLIYLFILYRFLPVRSPAADNARIREKEEKKEQEARNT